MKAPLGCIQPSPQATNEQLLNILIDTAELIGKAKANQLSYKYIQSCEVFLSEIKKMALKRMGK